MAGMESTAKRARLTPSAAGGDDGVDQISALDDDVLLRVLGLLDDARDAARAALLSRRWLRLWPRVPALRFASRPRSRAAPRSSGGEQCAAAAAALYRYVSSVNGVLAQRAQSGCAVETLSISYTAAAASGPTTTAHDREQVRTVAADAAQGWLRYAFQQGVRSFTLDLPPCALEGRTVVLAGADDQLLPPPTHTRLETVRLALGCGILRLPTAAAAVKFASLTDLSLRELTIEAGGVRLLNRLVSSTSCPRLKKLRMSHLRLRYTDEAEAAIRIDAGALWELRVDHVNAATSLELRTPRLQVLHIDGCQLRRVLRVSSAPRLEELALLLPPVPAGPGRPPRRLEFDDGELRCVRILKLCLWSHLPCDPEPEQAGDDDETEFIRGDEAEINDAAMLLIQRCSSVKCLHITLEGPKESEESVDLIQSKVPHLAHITSLTVNVSYSFERHDFGAGVANLLTRFSSLTHLSVHVPLFFSLDFNLGGLLGLECDHPADQHWTTHDISMAHLQEVELTGLTATDCELWFMKVVVASTKRLRKVAISFNPKCWMYPAKMAAFERMLLDQGTWTSHREAHKLTCHACGHIKCDDESYS